ncbi:MULTISPECIES: ribonuclease HII [Celeribacter]|jgi:ribonuclease HII|nr:ribonuclease HII [Celeribacter halophilus]MBU2890113.1 ribonuclease HII [Celeribacter halophilus]MDO6457671.1 ribonuclease HII [Celeribacter halophilus]MDO6511275.1 ribonuclease HII [Celeribacter halophilus]MDO6723929.1 ribonuclease HII [Celeribacter halophilus]
MVKTVPDYSFEEAAARRGYTRIVGVDEVGRGPLAGPVVAAAVWLDPDDIPAGLNDSKALSAKRREGLYDEICARADVSIASCSVEEIDEINILQASLRAMERAVAGLKGGADYVLVDGNKVPPAFGLDAEAIVKGDARSVSISAASIVAKIWRDRLMVDLAQQYPGYGWEKNAGYGTKLHLEGLRDFGVTPHHRRSFKPIHNILYQDKKLSD